MRSWRCFIPRPGSATFAPCAEELFAVQTGHRELYMDPTGDGQERSPPPRTSTTNDLIDLDGDRERQSSLHRGDLHANNAGGTDLVVVIRYIDKYERRDGTWRIADREIRFSVERNSRRPSPPNNPSWHRTTTRRRRSQAHRTRGRQIPDLERI